MPNVSERLQAALETRYRIEREVGRGGMAVVFLATDLKHNRLVALKVLREEVAGTLGAERFLREIEIVARLTHPHILPIHDSGDAGGILYYVMPYVEAQSLRGRLALEMQLPVKEAMAIAREVAEALDYAHGEGIVHRDIKPENILLLGGHAVVADFGIARAIQAGTESTLTATGVLIGTPAYMSPEQVSGEQRVDGRSDVYSLGCVLYEMLAGEPPFTGPTLQAVVARRLSETPRSLRAVREGVPLGLERAVARAMARSPADRFPAAREFAQALVAVSEMPATQETIVPGPVRSRLSLPIIAFGVVLTLALATFILVHTLPERSGHARISSLAVLPLENISGDTSQDYFADGMTDELITQLAQVGALRVIGRSSVMKYRGKSSDPRDVAKELRVEGIVEGTVLRSDQKVRIAARLVDPSTEQQIWAESYDRDLRDVLSLQNEVARDIARKIRIRLTEEEKAQLASARSVSPEAYEQYLKGRYHWNRRTKEDLLAAIGYFEEALKVDPEYAVAYAGLADTYVLMGIYAGRAPREIFPRAKEAALKALEFDARLAEAHASLGRVKLFFDWDWKGAEDEFQRAIDANPSYATAHHWYSILLRDVGKPDEAIAEAAKAVELDPLSLIINANLGDTYFYARRYDEAIAHHQMTLDLDPDFAPAHLYLGAAYEMSGMMDEALLEFQKARPRAGDSPYALGALARAEALGGRPGEAREILAQVIALSEGGPGLETDVALVYAALGEKEEAIKWLERAFEEHAGLNDIGVDPRLDSLRDEEGFRKLLMRMGLGL